MSVQTTATIASFGGKLLKLTHNATTTACKMSFNLYLPPQTTTNSLRKVPLLIYLAGLTCTGDNGAEKGFFQHAASRKGIAVLYPDTSPRGLKIEGEDESFDFGSGAGFYVDATKSPWDKGYKMYSYITEELPKTVFENFKEVDGQRVSIFGHSMGGHGALTLVCYYKYHRGIQTALADQGGVISSSKTQVNTSPFPPSLLLPTPATANGAKRPSPAISAKTINPLGPPTTPLSL
jgi:S-formylglutathione hydrolase